MHFLCMASLVASLLMVTIAYQVHMALGSTNEPDQTCVAPLETLLNCLPYAQGKTALPTPTCCTNMDKVFLSQKKCLCYLIAASFQGGVAGLPSFNRTIALHMPSACNIPADPSQCPGLLGIPSSSPTAKEFTDAALKSNGTSVSASNNTIPSTSSALTMKSNVASSHLSTSFASTLAVKSLLLLLYYIIQI